MPSCTAVFSNILTMHVSSLRPGAIATSSGDGMIAASPDDGQTWRKTDRDLRVRLGIRPATEGIHYDPS